MLVGLPLTATVSVFDDWAKKHGDGGVGLLAALGVKAAEGGAGAETAWRVGVRAPKDPRTASEGGAEVGDKAGPSWCRHGPIVVVCWLLTLVTAVGKRGWDCGGAWVRQGWLVG